MKTLGLIGGIGPESTIDYYQSIIERYRALKPDGSYPSFFINSIDLDKLRGFFTANQLKAATEYLLEELHRLARAGADFGLLAANTPHLVFDDLQRQSPLPLLSIVECACAEAKRLGFKRVGLFGTRFTMQARFYPEVFARDGITIVTPGATDQEFVHDKYMTELINGVFLPATHDELLAIVSRLKEKEQVDAVILGGTELPLILRESVHEGVALLDTTKIHCAAAVAEMLS